LFRVKRSAVVGVSAIVLLSWSVTACSSDETAPAAAGAPVPTSAASTKTVLDTSDAIPAGPHLQNKWTLKADPSGANTRVPMGIAADGSVLMNVGPSDDGDQKLRQRRMELWTADGTKTVVADGRSTRWGAVAQTMTATACGGVPVWADAHGTAIVNGDWRVWSRPAGSTRPVQIGDSKELVPKGDAPGAWAITTSGPTAYWDAARPVAKNKPNGDYQNVVVSRPLDGSGKLTVVASNASWPTAVGDKLFYVKHKRFAEAAENHFQIRSIQAGNDSLVRERTMPAGARLENFTATTGLTVLVVGDRSTEKDQDNDIATATMTLWLDGDDHPVTVKLHGDGANDVRVSGNLVVWGNGSGSGDQGMYVLDLGSRQIFKLGSLEGGSNATVCGDRISWAVKGKAKAFDHAFATWKS
jgi:hypothetical protein